MLNFWHQLVLFLGQSALAVLRNQDRGDYQAVLEEVEAWEAMAEESRQWKRRDDLEKVQRA